MLDALLSTIPLGLLILYLAPGWCRKVLALLRDFDAYRDERRQRQRRRLPDSSV